MFNSSLFAGGITNSGVLSAPSGEGVAINVHGVTTFTGGIVNSGTISALNDAVVINGFTTSGGIFSGDINNSRIITAGQTAISVTGGVLNFLGGIMNSGTISAGDVGIAAGNAVFANGISNSGTITAGGAGIDLASSSFSGGINNSGNIISTGAAGIGVGVTADVTTSPGGIHNAAGATIVAAKSGIAVQFVENFSGGITNSGTIAAGGSRAGVIVAVASTFAGGIANSGTISGGGVGIGLQNVTLFANDIVNGAGGTISGAHTGISLSTVSTFAGDISNSARSRVSKVSSSTAAVSAAQSSTTARLPAPAALPSMRALPARRSPSAIRAARSTAPSCSRRVAIFCMGTGIINGSLNAGNAVISPTFASNSGGILNVTGNYTQPLIGTLSIYVNPIGNSKLAVGGSASLNGYLSIYYYPGYYTGRTYTLVSAGSVAGTFSNVQSDPPPGVTQVLSYAANSVILTLTGSGVVGFFRMANPGYDDHTRRHLQSAGGRQHHQ